MRSVYLHHSFYRTRRNEWSFNDVQFEEFMDEYLLHNPMEGLVPDEEEHGEFPPFQGRPSPSMVMGILLHEAHDLPHGRTRGLRCTRRRAHTTLGLTITPEQEAPRGSSCYQLRPKA